LITPSEITKHLKTYLPVATDRFTETFTVASASMSALNILTVNVVGHGKEIGDKVVISGGTVRNPLTVSAVVDDTVQFTTKYDHDQTKPMLSGDTQKLTLDGFTGGDTSWNDDHQIIDVPNRRNFIVDGSLAPTVDETQYLKENLIIGVYPIATVPTADSFTIDFSGSPSLPAGAIDGLTVISGFRISAASDFNRAKAVYTKQTTGEAYLFVIMTDGDVSKDRHTFNDGQASFTSQDMHLVRMLRNFSTVVFLPTDDDLSGADAQDLAYDTIYSALIRVLFGFTDEDVVIKYSAVPVGDGPAEYNTAWYAHVYDWQLPTSLTFDDGFLPFGDVAFRDIVQTLNMFNNDTDAQMTANIDLDEDEL